VIDLDAINAINAAKCTTLVDLMRVLRTQDPYMYEAVMCLVRATVERNKAGAA
jgi:hypothetical protein